MQQLCQGILAHTGVAPFLLFYYPLSNIYLPLPFQIYLLLVSHICIILEARSTTILKKNLILSCTSQHDLVLWLSHVTAVLAS